MAKPYKHGRKAPPAKAQAAGPPPSLAERLPAFALGAVVATCVATPFVPSEGVIEQGVHIVLVALWFVLLLGWLLLGLCRGKLEVRWHATLLAVVALVAWIAIAGVVRASDGHPRFTLNVVWYWVSVALMMFLTAQFVRTAAEARALVVALAALAFVLALFGVYQYSYSLPKTRIAFEEDRERALAAAGVNAAEGSAEYKHYVDRLYSTEPFATFSLTNSLAGFIAPWLVMCVALLLAVWRERKIGDGARVALIGALLGLGYCLLLTKSRTALLAVIVGVALAFVYTRTSGRKFGWKIPLAAALALGGLFLLAVAAGGLDVAVLREAPKSVLVRLEYWRSTAAMIADYTWLGCGPGSFQDFFTQYKLPEASETVRDPHNFLLEIWATSGTPALFLLGGVFLAFALDLRRPAPQVAVNSPVEAKSLVAKRAPASGNPGAVAWGVIAGAAMGPALAFLAAFSFDPPDLVFLFLVAWPLAALGGRCLRDWVLEGSLPTSAVVVSLITLLLNLLAAGSLAYPGVTLSLWVLLAVALVNYAPATRERELGAAEILSGWGAASALAISFLFTCYLPVLRGTDHLGEAMRHVSGYRLRVSQNQTATTPLESALISLGKAQRADGYSSEPWLQMAMTLNAIWMATGQEEFGERFELAASQAVAKRPHSASVHAQVAAFFLQAYRNFGKPTHISEARRLAEAAVALYPNSNLYHAQLAWICFVAGDQRAAKAEAEEALRLDDILPHDELKLKHRSPADFGPSEGQTPKQPPAPTEKSLEQLMRRLRNLPSSP